MKELFQAIYSKYNGSTTFKAALTGGFIFGTAPQGTGYPYAVYTSYGSTPDDTFTSEINDVSVQINIYSDKSSTVECFDLLQSCKSLFKNAELTVSGHQNVILTQEMEQPPMISSGNIWMAVIEFSCLLQKN
jgi:hypothetical protein